MDGIEPVTSPAFAIAGGGEELIYEILSCSCAFVFNEGSDLFGSRKVAVEIDEEASSKSGEVGWGSKVEIVLIEFLLNEGVDGVSWGGGRGSNEFFEGPPVGVDSFCLGSGSGVRGAAFDPVYQDFNFFVRQLLFWRHLVVRVLVPDGGDDEGFFWFARDNGGAAITSFSPTAFGV